MILGIFICFDLYKKLFNKKISVKLGIDKGIKKMV